MRHVDEGRLHAWLDGELPADGPDGARELELHLAACPVCRARAEEERAIRDEAATILRGAVPGAAAAPEPADEVGRRRRAGGRRWVAVGWAASVLLALGIGWMARPSVRQPVALEAPASEAVEPPLPTPPARIPATRGRAMPSSMEPGMEAPTVADVSPAAVDAPLTREAARENAASPASAAPRPPSLQREQMPRRVPMGASAAADAAPTVIAPPLATPPVYAAPPSPPPPAPVAASPASPAPYAPSAPAAAAAAARTQAAGTVTVRGRVTDAAGLALAGAQVSVPELAQRTVTAADGSYALDLPAARLAAADSVTVLAQRIGSERQSRAFFPEEGVATFNFALPSAALSLDGIVVTGAEAPDAVAWREVDAAEAERRLGRRPVAVPQLPLLGVDVGRMEGRAAVRVRQRMDDGSVLSLVQRRAPRARSRQAEALSRAVTERGGWLIVLAEEGLVVDASAPVAADSLRRLPRPEARP